MNVVVGGLSLYAYPTNGAHCIVTKGLFCIVKIIYFVPLGVVLVVVVVANTVVATGVCVL